MRLRVAGVRYKLNGGGCEGTTLASVADHHCQPASSSSLPVSYHNVVLAHRICSEICALVVRRARRARLAAPQPRGAYKAWTSSTIMLAAARSLRPSSRLSSISIIRTMVSPGHVQSVEMHR